MLLPECGDQGDGHLLGGRSCESTEGRKGGPERQPAGQPEHAGGGGKEGHFVWGKEGEGRRLFDQPSADALYPGAHFATVRASIIISLRCRRKCLPPPPCRKSRYTAPTPPSSGTESSVRTPPPSPPAFSRSPPPEPHRSLAEWVAKLAPRLQLDTSPQQLRIAHVRDGGREVDIWDGKPAHSAAPAALIVCRL